MQAQLVKKLSKPAKQFGYEVSAGSNEWLVLLRKDTDQGRVQIAVYLTKKTEYTGLYTVSTALNHPKKGKTQLHRKHINFKDVLKIIENPRTHTGVGYYEK